MAANFTSRLYIVIHALEDINVISVSYLLYFLLVQLRCRHRDIVLFVRIEQLDTRQSSKEVPFFNKPASIHLWAIIPDQSNTLHSSNYLYTWSAVSYHIDQDMGKNDNGVLFLAKVCFYNFIGISF
jgi:hypothetical protein